MEEIVVKSEMQSNGEILLFYVDENGGNEEGVLTTVENIESQAMQLQEDNSYVIEDVAELTTDISLGQTSNHKEHWTQDDIKRLLVFYNDNKQTFISGATKREHLWTVACKTMLIGKTPNSCEVQLQSLREKYSEICGHLQKGIYVKWPYFQLCHQVFQDENCIAMNTAEPEYDIQIENPSLIQVPVAQQNFDGLVVIKNVNPRIPADEKVLLMLNLYLKNKKSFQQEYWRRGLWESIAMEIGEEDWEYWQKRFLNYKQHYLRLLEKRNENSSYDIQWPYMTLFDQIFDGDMDFQKKYATQVGNNENEAKEFVIAPIDWDNTEMTVLVKYCFDCFDEFQDRTIPNGFLWNEIGRLLDKTADACKQKYEELKVEHLDKYIRGGYNIRLRKPIEIVFDNIIEKEISAEINATMNRPEQLEIWKMAELDELVQFFYDNIELYKDLGCHFVCWAAVVKKLKKSLQSCRGQWVDLVSLYKTILEDKKENPDMQIDWRYIEVFDRIFDYGMDISLLSGYEKLKPQNENATTGKIGVKKVNIKMDEQTDEFTDDDETYDESGSKRKSRTGDSKAFKILEFYQKNKDKLSSASNRNKHSVWQVLANQIGISATQCAHRFRNLKQVYIAYVQREINKPEMPILWPYYALCKKVFGYRAIKSKLKNGKMDSDDSEDWSAKEIKQLINYFSKYFDEINYKTDDSSRWSDLASEIGKSEMSCKDKFLELRKSFRKLKTMRTRNPDVKISWKYFNMFEQIYSEREGQQMEVDGENMMLGGEDRNEQEEDDYQCIIVIPEGEDISQMENTQIIIQDNAPQPIETKPKPLNKWTKRTKKRLLILYINYVRSHKGKEIVPKSMWAEIASKLTDKTPLSCRKMFAKLKTSHNQNSDDVNNKITPYCTLLEKVKRLKPKFVKSEQIKNLQGCVDGKVYKDVVLPDDKVENALMYYLQHIEDFVSPRFEKKYLWIELANYISEPVTKVFNKINYLRQIFNTNELTVQTPFDDLLKEILAKEIAIKLVIENEPKPIIEDCIEETWSDEETEQLLEWYLSNLDKFKNPKFVRSYLWMEASIILKKSAIVCSKKMSEIRTQYRNMVRERPEELNVWRFHDLCQKIYGTGKKGGTASD